MITLLAVLVGGCAGAVARQEIYSALQQRAGIRFPVGILVVNLSGSFVLGLLYGVGASDHWPHWLATGVQTGVIGAYTTYSTWAVDSLMLARDGRRGEAVVNLAGSLVGGVLVAWGGATLGTALLATARMRTVIAGSVRTGSRAGRGRQEGGVEWTSSSVLTDRLSQSSRWAGPAAARRPAVTRSARYACGRSRTLARTGCRLPARRRPDSAGPSECCRRPPRRCGAISQLLRC